MITTMELNQKALATLKGQHTSFYDNVRKLFLLFLLVFHVFLYHRES